MKESILPDKYIELEYIEQPLGNSGYFKTGLYPSDNLDFDICGVPYDNIANGSGYGCIFGSRTSATYEYQLNTYIEPNAPNKGTLRVGTLINDPKLVKNQEYKISLQGTRLECDGAVTNITRDWGDNNPAEIYVWAFNVGDGGTDRVRQNGHGKIKYLRFRQNGEAVRYYIPCMTVDNHTVGFYDAVNDTFNPSLATAFVAGPRVSAHTMGIAQQLIDLQVIKEQLRQAIHDKRNAAPLAYHDGLVDYADEIDLISNTPATLPTEPKAVNFIDYDGTLLYAYTAQEFQALSGLPHNPFHSGLVAQGWNWTRAEILDYLNTSERIDISQNYITNDGSTRLYIRKTGQLNQQIQIYQSTSYGVEINWGDNTTSTAQSGTGTKTFTHTYPAKGDYIIRIIPKAGTFDFGSNPTGTSDLQNGAFGNPQTYEALVHELYKVELGSNFPRFSSCSFQNAHNLKEISIPREVKEFRHRCLRDCYSLKHVAIPDGASLLANCCYGQLRAQYFCLPPHLTVSGAQIFRYHYAAEYVLLPDSITGTLPTGMFYSCHNLKTARLPQYITRMGPDVFRDCYSLARIKIPTGVVAFQTTDTYTDYSYTFGSCFSLASLDLPEGVTMIHAYFNMDGLGLYFLTLPSTLTIIGANAFKNYATKWMIVKAAVPPTIQSNSFYNNTSMSIYVPYSADHSILAAYQEATNWSTYAATMKELDENGNIPEES